MRRLRYWTQIARIFLRGRRNYPIRLRCTHCGFVWPVEIVWNAAMTEYNWPRDTRCPVCLANHRQTQETRR